MNKTINLLEKTVTDFSFATGLSVGSGKKADMVTHKAIISEEVKEFVDGGIDTLVTLMRLYIDSEGEVKAAAMSRIESIAEALKSCGINVDEGINKVFDANMSKLCKTDIQAKLTQEKYSDIGVETVVKTVDNGLFAVYCSKDVTGKDGKFYKEGKLLKNVDWHEPDWSDSSEWTSDEWFFID